MTTPILELFRSRTTNGTSDSVTYDGDKERVDVYFSGTFNGASINLEAEPGNYNGKTPIGFVPISGATAITAPTMKTIEITRNTKIRAVVSGGGGSMNINIIAHYNSDGQNAYYSSNTVTEIAPPNTGNTAPTDITLSNATIAENVTAGHVIGALSTTDGNVGDTFTYSIVTDSGNKFAISGANLVVRTGATFDYETATSHSVTIRSTDQGGLFFNKTFVISVTNVTELPVTPVLVLGTITSSSVALSVTMSNDVGVTDYIWEHRVGTSGSWIVFSDGTSATKNTVVTGLDELVTYNFRAKSVNTDGQSSYSNIVSAKTLAPFSYDANTLWWEFNNADNPVEPAGDDTYAAIFERLHGEIHLIQENKSHQPLVATKGANFNQDTNRRLIVINPAGITNNKAGWYIAVNCYPVTGDVGLMGISRNASATIASRGEIYITGSRQFALKAANNDGGTTAFVGYTNAITLANWYTLEMLFNISSGVGELQAWINGVEQTLSVDNNPTFQTAFSATNPNQITVGNLAKDYATSFDGQINNMIFQNGIPSTDIRASISSFLNTVRTGL